MKRSLLLGVLLLGACQKTAAPAARWSEIAEGHYLYRVMAGDEITANARRFNEESYRSVSTFFGVSEPARVTFVKYPDMATKQRISGVGGNAHRVGSTLHTIWPTDRHEIVHILGDRWGDPPALVAEGLAVLLSGGWQGKPVRVYARELAQGGGWIAPSAILASRAFRSLPDLRTYAVGAAFVEWLLTTRGKEVVRRLYGALRNTAPEAQNRRTLESTLSAPLSAIDGEVKRWVETP
jgi:hypothetical protein